MPVNNVQVSKTQFSSSFAGSALIQPPTRVTFTLSGVVSGGERFETKTVPVPNGVKYYSDGIYTLVGNTGYTPSTIWKKQPRNFYLIDESHSPIPRVYLSKLNKENEVTIGLQLTNLGGGTFTLSKTYQVHVDIFLFTSNNLY